MDMKLEVVLVPVSDVDRAKGFYESLGWRLDADFAIGDDFRVVQLTPPGSACSIIFGSGVTTAVPGSVQGLQLVVADIDAAPRRARRPRRRRERGVPRRRRVCSTTPGRTDGRPVPLRSMPAMARLPRSATRTATAGCSKR